MATKPVSLKTALKQLLATLLILGVVFGGGYYAVLWKIGRDLNEKGQGEAREGVQEIAKRLHELNLAHGSLLPDITPERLAEWIYKRATESEEIAMEALESQAPEHDWRWGKFDYFGYSIEVRGEAPRYTGTTVTYHGEGRQQRIVLTISDLAASEWSAVEDPPLPWWRLLWCD